MDDFSGRAIGQYTLMEMIGEGAQATVYRAIQGSIGREVAVKLVPQALSSEQKRERFYREVKTVAALQHPHILPVYDFGEIDGMPYVVMSLMPGGTLADYIYEFAPLSLDETAHFVSQIAKALALAHERGVVHRDLKPSNVLVDHFDDYPNAYLTDFGLAAVTGDADLTNTGAVIGTPAYMAPDWAYDDELTGSVDIYALGVMMYEMLTGQLPYTGANIMSMLMAHISEPLPDVRLHRPDLPGSAAAVVMRTMAKKPDERYPTPQAVADALSGVVARQSTPSSGTIQVTNQFYYPLTWGRSSLETAEEVLGKENLDAVLVHAGLTRYIDNYPADEIKKGFSFDDMGALLGAIYKIYGPRGAQAVGRQAGRQVQRQGFEKYSGLTKVAQAVLRMAPDNQKMLASLNNFARLFNHMSDQVVEVERMDDAYIWRITRCPVCWGYTADRPVGYFAVGVLEEACEWVDDTKTYRITETECIAMGDPHGTFIIEEDVHSD